MFYREAGQFKTTYAADQALLPIRQDRYALFAILAVAFVGIPLFAGNYWLTAILIPFLVFSLAALGLNILTGYAGQLSLGSAATTVALLFTVRQLFGFTVPAWSTAQEIVLPLIHYSLAFAGWERRPRVRT